MNDACIAAVRLRNNMYVPEFMGVAQTGDPVKPNDTGEGVADSGMEYMYTTLYNILLGHHPNVAYELPSNLAEMVSWQAYMASLHLRIFSTDGHASAFCDALSKHKLPPGMLLYDFLLWAEQCHTRPPSIWIPMLLQLFAFTDTKKCQHHPYRSRFIIGAIQHWAITRSSGNHQRELTFDEFNIRLQLSNLIKLISRDMRHVHKDYIVYAIDSVRLLSVAYFATVLKSSIKAEPLLTTIGSEVLAALQREHQKVVDTHYLKHSKGELYDTAKSEHGANT